MARYPSLDGDPLLATDPGPDTVEQPLSYHVDAILARIGRDGMIDGEEQAELQRLLAGVDAIGQQKLAAQGFQQGPMGASDETSDFGSAEGVEGTEEPMPGAQYAGPLMR